MSTCFPVSNQPGWGLLRNGNKHKWLRFLRQMFPIKTNDVRVCIVRSLSSASAMYRHRLPLNCCVALWAIAFCLLQWWPSTEADSRHPNIRDHLHCKTEYSEQWEEVMQTADPYAVVEAYYVSHHTHTRSFNWLSQSLPMSCHLIRGYFAFCSMSGVNVFHFESERWCNAK